MISIISKNKKRQIRLWAVAFWLLIWQAASMAIGQEILLVSPVAVLQRLKTLVWESTFWLSCAFSVLRIVSGFLLGTALGWYWEEFLLVFAEYGNFWHLWCLP